MNFSHLLAPQAIHNIVEYYSIVAHNIISLVLLSRHLPVAATALSESNLMSPYSISEDRVNTTVAAEPSYMKSGVHRVRRILLNI